MRKKFLTISMAVLLLICVSTVFAQTEGNDSRMRIAILDLKSGESVNQQTAKLVSDILRSEMINTGHFIVIERGQMDAILNEQGFQASGCTDTECAVQIGKLLAANKMLVGTVAKLGTTYIISARIVDVEKGTADFAENVKADNEEDLMEACSTFAQNIAQRITEHADNTKSSSKKKQVSTITTSGTAPLFMLELYGGMHFGGELPDNITHEYETYFTLGMTITTNSRLVYRLKELSGNTISGAAADMRVSFGIMQYLRLGFSISYVSLHAQGSFFSDDTGGAWSDISKPPSGAYEYRITTETWDLQLADMFFVPVVMGYFNFNNFIVMPSVGVSLSISKSYGAFTYEQRDATGSIRKNEIILENSSEIADFKPNPGILPGIALGYKLKKILFLAQFSMMPLTYTSSKTPENGYYQIERGGAPNGEPFVLYFPAQVKVNLLKAQVGIALAL